MVDLDVQFEAVYDELKQIAVSRLQALSPGQSLHATVLVHEAYLRLIKQYSGDSPSPWSDRGIFFAAASEAMRRIIIDHYRRKTCRKRRGRCDSILLEPGTLAEPSSDSGLRGFGYDLLEIEDALSLFEAAYPEKAHVVKLRFFVGMTMAECADALEISLSTAERHWRFARAWLADRLR